MREHVLRRFFEGKVTATDLSQDLAGSTKKVSALVSHVSIEDMDESLNVTRSMLISLCDAVLAGSLPPGELRTIGFALEVSDKFEWDGGADELVANVIADWACPEINYALTIENVRRFRSWLTGNEPYPAKLASKVDKDGKGKIISVTEKESVKRRWYRKLLRSLQ